MKRRVKLQRESSSTTTIGSENRLKEMRVLQWRFFLLAVTTPLASTIMFISYGIKARNSGFVSFYVDEFYQCLKRHPDSNDCPKTFLDYQYSILAIVADSMILLLLCVLLAYIFLAKEARSALAWYHGLVKCLPHCQGRRMKEQSGDVCIVLWSR